MARRYDHDDITEDYFGFQRDSRGLTRATRPLTGATGANTVPPDPLPTTKSEAGSEKGSTKGQLPTEKAREADTQGKGSDAEVR